MYIDIYHILYGIECGMYRYIGAGSARKVYDLNNGFVIKIARNIKGIAQNEAEFLISNDDESSLFAKVYFLSDDYKYLIMEKANGIKSEKELLNYFKIQNKKQLKSNEDIKEVHDKYNLVWADLYKFTSWGKIKDKLVLIDYGYTKEIYNKFYKKID
ncbi:hypothetical protein [uncultured Clostridium sp.]|jgi:hypothetical protein|uniref:hypothetical protein n=1 Tax=uncultured Clostridium sp. TaxID=59620 RepID=UPI0025DEBE95|nr:hypothetical protein [uncultured Clostridium sp.]